MLPSIAQGAAAPGASHSQWLQSRKEAAFPKAAALPLGPPSLPPPAPPLVLQELHQALDQVNTSLERFSGVNRKALDQYMSFTQQRDELGARLKEQVGG